MRTPVLVVAGLDRAAMEATMLSLLWDLPGAVAVSHAIDPEAQTLTRVVSDANGIVETASTDLEHSCVGCALRADILPTIDRLSRDGRWRAIVQSLPAGAEPDHLGRALTRDPHVGRHARLASIIAALGPDTSAVEFLGPEHLRDRGLHTSPEDERGLGETACAIVEYADVVVSQEDLDADTDGLIRALVRPDASVLVGMENLPAGALAGDRHRSAPAWAWRLPVSVPLPALDPGPAWRLDLSSPLPFHPERLMDEIERLGSGPFRSRGCFWVPTRPEDMNLWEGSGGQLSLGYQGQWAQHPPRTRLVLTGLGSAPRDVELAFEDLLVDPADVPDSPGGWQVPEDGLEPWLGDIRPAA